MESINSQLRELPPILRHDYEIAVMKHVEVKQIKFDREIKEIYIDEQIKKLLKKPDL